MSSNSSTKPPSVSPAQADQSIRIERLQRSEQHSHQRVEKSLSRLDAVSRRTASAAFAGDSNPTVEAVRHAFAAMGLDISAEKLIVDADDQSSIVDIARQAGGRARQIILTQDWHRQELGPLLAVLLDEDSDGQVKERIVSLVRRGRRYQYRDHASGKQGLVNNALAARFHSIAYLLYPPLPEKASKLSVLGRFLWHEVRQDTPAIIGSGAVIALLGAVFPLVTALIIDTLIPGSESSMLIQLGLGLGLASVVIFVFNIMQARVSLRIDGRTTNRLQAAIWDKILRLPAGFFKKFSAGDLNARIADIEAVREALLDFILSATVTTFFSLFYLILLFAYLPQLATLAILLVIIFAALSFAAGWLQLKYIKRQAKANGRLSSMVFQFLQGIIKLRVANAEGRAFAQWADRYADERQAMAAIRRISNHYSAIADAFQTLALVMLFTAAFYLADEQVSAGIFIAFLSAYAAFQSAFVGMSRAILSLFSTMPYLVRAKPILDAETEQQSGAAHPGTLQGAIQLSQVTFSYITNGEEILKDLSLSVKAGEHIALVGSSGSGKSTLLRILLGFEMPQSGTVLYDGQDLASLDLAALRRQIGVVLQSGRIFAGSIFDNIRGASTATLEDCLQAASDAGLDRDLELFPMGLHTPLTEGATTISGGQRQRILIARALVKKPRILFMDEATSALDNRSQGIVTSNLEQLAVTRLVIAHRLSTIRNADRIIVLDKGQIVESGNYDELMERDGYFAELARRQLV